MLIPDTNVASELMRPSPAPNVVAWIAERDATAMHLTAVSEAELRFGVAILPAGRRRSAIETAMRQLANRSSASARASVVQNTGSSASSSRSPTPWGDR